VKPIPGSGPEQERKNMAEVNAGLQEQKERADTVDFKMITFSLGGRGYAVDIMNVKEIAKADNFTYVPNAASFVRGVYNLRGDIIPIVDLRTFFHLPADKKQDGMENMLILRIGDRVYGTIVDKIHRVVGINSEAIQPPHPIFRDINIKYISGGVEKQGELFIILDVIRIFTQSEEDKASADAFLRTFPSPNTGAFWNDDYANTLKSILPDMPSNSIQVWNPGCGKGYETYSLACILKSRYPKGHIKIWANDSDIMAISSAPGMSFDLPDVPEYCREFMSKGTAGYGFSQAIKDSILFEYHDVLNENTLPELDIILGRDLLSFLNEQQQEKIMADFSEKVKARGLIVLGTNEKLPENEWIPVGKGGVSAFIRA
jgi:chemotaxis signal transduction protein